MVKKWHKEATIKYLKKFKIFSYIFNLENIEDLKFNICWFYLYIKFKIFSYFFNLEKFEVLNWIFSNSICIPNLIYFHTFLINKKLKFKIENFLILFVYQI